MIPKLVAKWFLRDVPDRVEAVKVKFAETLADAGRLGLDPGTIALLLQFFGPLIQALIAALIAKNAPPA